MLSPSFYVVPHNKSGSTTPLAPARPPGSCAMVTHSYAKRDWFAHLSSWIEMVIRMFFIRSYKLGLIPHPWQNAARCFARITGPCCRINPVPVRLVGCYASIPSWVRADTASHICSCKASCSSGTTRAPECHLCEVRPRQLPYLLRQAGSVRFHVMFPSCHWCV
jgi:hypothetical protein